MKAKSEAKAGSSIGITVSKGSDKPAKRVSVPSLIGMTQTQAEDVLASLKLVSKAEDPVYSEDAKPGTIFKQSVAAARRSKRVRPSASPRRWARTSPSCPA